MIKKILFVLFGSAILSSCAVSHQTVAHNKGYECPYVDKSGHRCDARVAHQDELCFRHRSFM